MRGLSIRTIALAAIVIVGFGFGCGGGCGGCGGMTPIPGGFIEAKRNPNAAQLRVTQTALDHLEADPAGVVGGLLGGGPLQFNMPASCGGQFPICCPGGVAATTCGPLDINLTKMGNDDARLVLTPVDQGAINGELAVTVRARLKTVMDIPITILGGECGLQIDTTKTGNNDAFPDVEIKLPIDFTQDGQIKTTRMGAGTVAVNRLTSNDLKITGSDFRCFGADLAISFALSFLVDQVKTQIQDTVNSQTCKACPSGDVAECGTSFATKCDAGVCKKADDSCVQELGIDGRMSGVGLFGSLSPGTTGALDIYEVMGGYATGNASGLSLGMLGGMEPGGTARDRCGPAATAPAQMAIPKSVFFQGNTRPDNGDVFDVAIGVHQSQLGQFAFAGYDGGLLCLTLGHNTIAQLSTDTIGIVSHSLGKLAPHAPMAIGLRPQAPPVIVLGKNTFKDDGTGTMIVDEPLLDITFHQMELDFFASIDDQYVRVFTVVSDVHLPINLQVTAMGELAPVLGNVDEAFTNLSVKNSEAVTESPESLAALFPDLLGLVLPSLSGALPSIALPALGGLQLSVNAITAVPTAVGGTTNDFLAIYANLAADAAPREAVDTTADIRSIDEPSAAVLANPRAWPTAHRAAVELDLASTKASSEYSIRIDHGTWSAWSTNARPRLSPRTFFLSGTHAIEVRAREVGHPESMDETPAVLSVDIGDVPQGSLEFHGAPGAGSGCGNCSASGSATGSLPFLAVLGFLIIPWRRARRAIKEIKRLGAVAWLAAIACMPACSCSTNPCGDKDCLPGDVEHGSFGKFTSIAADSDRVIVATYDKGLGDLVAVDVTDPANPIPTFVDGIPEGVAPTHDPASYRHGIEEAGPNVGTHTSIAMAGGLARIAYHDVDGHALKYAAETKATEWKSYVVEQTDGEVIGRYTSIAIDADGNPAIAYLALGGDDGMNHRTAELRIARANSNTPASQGDWTITAVATGLGSCASLCEAGTACIADGTTGEQSCIAPTSDCTTACATGEVCNAGACTAELLDVIEDIPAGTGLFPNLVVLGDGRLAVVFYDRNARALTIAVEDSNGGDTYTSSVIDTVTPGDRGMWADAIVDNGTVHIAYQDALGDQLLYTTWNGTPGTPMVVDDGQRAGDRTHPVGTSASIYIENGAPSIAYQDGLTSDVYIASMTNNMWVTSPLAQTLILDGFSIAATTGHGEAYIAWDQITPANPTPNSLAVQKN